MKTVHEVSKLAGVSIRTLQYYDKIGLLRPAEYTEAGYRLYDDADLRRLQQILLFRELEFPLKDIKKIIESPDFDSGKALEQQIALLTLKKEHIENLIDFARGIKALGVDYLMNFEAFDMSKLDEYAAQVKASWGNTPQYKEFQEKSKNWNPEEDEKLRVQFMSMFKELGELKDQDPASAQVQTVVSKMQAFITEHFYTCTDKILSGLGKMYAGGGDFTKNIDEVGGVGTAEFANRAIQIYCG
ncbi:MAG: MerR family transcriptional regulator [Lachnospiraceae bacterium]|nr:MerR family transcriptional regulator [Lachnospiraceae bacterium]